jgi:hypothetical protein
VWAEALSKALRVVELADKAVRDPAAKEVLFGKGADR